GLAPIRARKLRHYEDRNFQRRLLKAPALSGVGYADRPLVRSDDWSGRNVPAPMPSASAGSLGEDSSGGLQQERHPGLAKPRRVKRTVPEQLDLLGLGDDDTNPAVDARTMDRLVPPASIVAAHAVNEGSGRGGDLMPSF
ncbi:MAG: conjugal transfer protein TraG, partial [Sphingomicrobium sp.]